MSERIFERGGLMTKEPAPSPAPLLGEIANLFLDTLSPEKRDRAQAEVQKFVRWYGAGRALGSLSPRDIESYAEQLPSTIAEMGKVEHVRAMLAWAHRKKWSNTNLSVHIRVRRAGLKSAGGKANTTAPVCLTDQGYKDLQAELARLIEERPKIADMLEKARADRDFRENAPLDAAREHQAQVEARIRELEAIMNTATMMSQAESKGSRIVLGDTISLCDLASGEETCFTLVSSREANPVKGKISNISPTGKCVIGKTEGETVEVPAPAGVVRYKITKVTQRTSG